MDHASLVGFVSVSYQGCNRHTYEEIVQDRSYFVEKNQEQLSSVLFYILVAVVFWEVIVLLILKYAQPESTSHAPFSQPKGSFQVRREVL